MKLQNPFLLSGYVSPEYFCERKAESDAMFSALTSGRHVVLTGLRRMGKTSLVRHVFRRLKDSQKAKCHYVDLYHTDSLASLVVKLGNALLRSVDMTEKKSVKRVNKHFDLLNKVITNDDETGKVSLTGVIEAGTEEQLLNELLNYLGDNGKQCYIAFDEFQTVANYPDKQAERRLQGVFSKFPNIGFVFCGNDRGLLEEMFSTPYRPFNKFATLVNIDRLDLKSYYDFALDKFQRHFQQLDLEAFTYLYDALSGHTWYIQVVLSKLYESSKSKISEAYARKMMAQIIEENDATYHTYLNLITRAQGRVTWAIACEGQVSELLAQGFLTTYQLGATSTVKSAAKALVEKELLLREGDAYQVYDRFFALWLQEKGCGSSE